MTFRRSCFRPAPTPSIPLPFGLRSLGLYSFAMPGPIEDQGPRPFLQLYWGEAGRVGFTVDDGEVQLGPSEVFVYPSLARQRLRALAPGTRYRWFTLDGPLADACVEAFGLRAPWPRSAGPPPEKLFARATALLADPSQGSEREAAVLAQELLANAAAGGNPTVDPRVEALRRLLIAGASDPSLSVARLADRLGEDRSSLTRRFTRVLGLAPKPFLQSLRLGRAMSLLHATDAPVAAIARDCGFSDPGYFARAFRQRTGLSPEGFRGR